MSISSTSAAPRYDRIASLVLVISLGLAAVLLIDINPNVLRARLPADLPTITISWLLLGILVIIASTGADLLARSHPEMQTQPLPTLNLLFIKTEIAPGFWVLPSFSVIGSFAFFRLFGNTLQGAAFVLALVGAGLLLLTVLTAQHYALDRNREISQRGQLVLQIVAYLLVFACCSAIYFERFRTLYSASLIGLTGLLLAYAVLRWKSRNEALLLGFLVGLLLAETTWAINYWPAPFLLGGAVLLLAFYVAVNLLQLRLTEHLKPHFALEYSLVGVGVLGAIVYAIFFLFG